METGEQQLLARWSGSVRDADCSPLEFYDAVERSITESRVPDVRFSHFTRREGGLFSPYRIYLRIRHKLLFFDLCAFLSGNSFVVSYWLHIDRYGIIDLLAEIPGIGFLIENAARPATYYTVDSLEHYQREVHEAILHVVDELADTGGGAALLPEERQPIWERIW